MSGSLISGVVGAGIGSIIGGPSGAMYGWSVGNMVGNLLFPQHVDGPRLIDLKPQASEYGRPIPIVYGTVALGGSVIWASDYVDEAQDSGGKGGPSVTTHSYFGNFAIAFAEGECSVGRMWAGPEKRLIWDGFALEGGGSVRIYTGSEDQLPDALMESYLGVGNVPAYRGTCYVVFEHFPLIKDGNTIPFITAEVGQAKLSDPPPPVVISPLSTPAFQSPTVAVDPKSNWIWTVSAPSLGTTFTVTVLSDRTQEVIWQQTFDSPYQILSVGEITVTPDGSQVFILFTPWVGQSREALVAEFSPGTANATGGMSTPPVLIAINTWGARTGTPNPMDPWTIHATGMFVWIAYALTNAADVHLARFNRNGTHADGSYIEIYPGFSIGQPSQILGDDQYIAVYGSLSSSLQNVVVINASTGSVVTSLYLPVIGSDGGKPLSYDTKRKRFAGPVTGGFMTVDAVTGAVATQTITLPIGSPPGVPIGMMYDARLDKYVYIQYGFGADSNSTTLFLVDPVTGIAQSYWTYPVGELIVGPMLEPMVTTGAPYIITFSNTTAYRLYLGGMSAGPGMLGEIVADLHQRAGLFIGTANVDALTDIVDGYTIARQTTVRNAIDALRPAYYFDAVESGGIVKYVKRGGAPVATIDADDLDARSDGQSPGDPLLTTRQMEVELPRVVNVNYLLAATDYSPATKSAKRLVGASGNEVTLDLPLVLTDTKAQEIADVNLQVAWVQRLSYAFNLPRRYSDLEPTDHIVVKGNGVRLTKITHTPQGVMKCEAVADGTTFYTPNTTVANTPPNQQVVYVPGTTTLELM